LYRQLGYSTYHRDQKYLSRSSEKCGDKRIRSSPENKPRKSYELRRVGSSRAVLSIPKTACQIPNSCVPLHRIARHMRFRQNSTCKCTHAVFSMHIGLCSVKILCCSAPPIIQWNLNLCQTECADLAQPTARSRPSNRTVPAPK